MNSHLGSRDVRPADSRQSGWRLGGLSSVASGLLFAARAVMDRAMGQPPSSGTALVAWKETHRLTLAWANELAFFSAVLLIPVVVALYRRLDGPRRPWVGFGCGILASTVPLVLVLVVFQGRLTYPVYDIQLNDSQSIALVLSLYYGAAHVLALMFAAALTMLGIVLLSGPLSPWPTVLAVAAAATQVAASYPWLIGTDAVLVCQLLTAAWFVVIGLLLLRPADRPRGEEANRLLR